MKALVHFIDEPDELSITHYICDECGSADTLKQLQALGCMHERAES